MKKIGVAVTLGALLSSACGGSVTHTTETGSGSAGGPTGSGGASSATTFAATSTSGTTSGAGGSVGAGGATGPGPTILPRDENCPTLGISMPLALTNGEYDNTVRDLLGDDTAWSVEVGFPDDALLIGGFRIDPYEAQSPSWTHRLSHFVEAASRASARARTHLSDLLPCDPATAGEDACATQFISSFGMRAFRRPLSPDDAAMLLDQYRMGRMGGTFEAGIGSVITAALLSPHFLLVEEGGAPDSTVRLDPYSIASRLSYFLYRSMPDPPLFDAAATGKLVTPEDMAREARRMLADPKAHPAVVAFFSEWLTLDRLTGSKWSSLGGETKDAALYPTFAGLRDFMRTETTMFTESIFFGDAHLSTLLTSSRSWINAPLAKFYGVFGGIFGSDGLEFHEMPLDDSKRAGLLTQASFLSMTSGETESSPTQRGVFVDRQLLCIELPPPPANVVIPPPPSTSPDQTTREKYAAAIGTQPLCEACHVYFDPVGFGLENFDAAGAYRSTQGGKPVDVSGAIRTQNGGSTPFNGPIELAAKLAESNEVRDCVAQKWLQFAVSRPITDDDNCSLRAIQGAFRTNGNLQDLVVSIAASRTVRFARW